jgi:hypothetical protein
VSALLIVFVIVMVFGVMDVAKSTPITINGEGGEPDWFDPPEFDIGCRESDMSESAYDGSIPFVDYVKGLRK